MAAKGGQCLEKTRRCVRTVFFMVAMLVSLLVTSLPVLVAVVDVLVPCVLLSYFTCVSCYGFKEHLHRYAFKSSLTDIPLVSVIRSLIILCVYTICDAPALSHGPYLGTVKVCVFTVNSQIEVDAAASISRQRLHLKKSWGMPVLFLSSVVFALGHTVVAYRTSCRARRKLIFHRVDPEAVLSCKNVFSGYQKVPRSPTPSGGRTPKSDSEMRRRPFGTACEEELSVSLLADSNSLFITCQGLILHYKLSLPGSPSHSLSSTSFLESNSSFSSSSMPGALAKCNRHLASMAPKIQRQLLRSYSNQFRSTSLYAPLLDGSMTSQVPSEDIRAFRLDEICEEDEANKLDSISLEQNLEGIEPVGQIGIVLVHGFGGGVFSWRHVMDSLARQSNCPVAAFDRPGWGLTTRLRQEDWEEKDLPNPYKLESQVDLLLSFCSEIGFSSVVLVGHDDGGLLALKAAQKVQSSPSSFNVTIKGVVLLSVSLSREVVPSFARILLHTSLGKKHLVRPLLRTEICQVVNRRAWYDATKLTGEVLTLYKAPLYVEGWDEALHEIGKLSSEIILSTKNADSLLEAAEDTPVLVIAGAEDSLVSLKSCQAMASKLRLVAISGCGHLPHEECPKALLAAITPFITRLLSVSDLQGH
ncbi:putative haloalkane dehalogenase [Senna tora]|uniref:Putative haloalkane dehalogenase n=1 Tax=Senna tora TaxID=362788 RepID=A0A834WAI4_9FABA|nr:putative haloalkane dehalogenase [Senna tora]